MIQPLHRIMVTLYWQIEGYSGIEGEVKELPVMAEMFRYIFAFLLYRIIFFFQLSCCVLRLTQQMIMSGLPGDVPYRYFGVLNTLRYLGSSLFVA